MNFRQLEAFVFVVQYRSFSKAAEELYLSQPTVSTHISSLEEELGVQLITRSSKVVTPTLSLIHIWDLRLRRPLLYPAELQAQEANEQASPTPSA